MKMRDYGENSFNSARPLMMYLPRTRLKTQSRDRERIPNKKTPTQDAQRVYFILKLLPFVLIHRCRQLVFFCNTVINTKCVRFTINYVAKTINEKKFILKINSFGRNKKRKIDHGTTVET